MTVGPLRFLHAADFHLEMPLFGVPEVPEGLREWFIEAPYWAAERVFQTAVAERADFVVLSGDILDARATGPRGPLFLVEQFQRLADRKIAVYWAGGRVDPPERWFASIRLPENVHVFPGDGFEELVFSRHSEPLARIVGTSCPNSPGPPACREQFASDRRPFRIAAAYGRVDPAGWAEAGMDYVALGGRHQAETLSGPSGIVRYCGTHQGRQPEESGPHGCTLVDVDAQGRAHTEEVAADVLRWQTERIGLGETTTRGELEARMVERIRALQSRAGGTHQLILWILEGSGPLLAQLRRGAASRELLEALRSRHRTGSPAAWSVSLEVSPEADLPAEWYQQETIRGDYLRAIRRPRSDPNEALDLEPYLPAEHGPELAAAAELADPAVREKVLQEAARLGADLLSGEEPRS